MRCHIRLSLNFPREASARYVFQFFAEMLDFIESDEESENFEGFNDDDVNGYESESDISISSVGSEDISDVENLLAKMKPKKQIFYSVFKFTTVECPTFHFTFWSGIPVDAESISSGYLQFDFY